ncbi:cobalamin-dependent protein [bacterium]|nr:cobalamin-dependent protein [candidate division CSSED10-310 bacterium]
MKERYGDLLEAGAVYPSMGLAYIASAALMDGHRVSVLDAEACHLTFDDIADRIRDELPDIIGMQTFCANLSRCYRVADTAKSIDPGIQVVLGGVQVTLFPQEQFEHPSIDIVVRGEGERAFRAYLSAMRDNGKLEDVPGISYRDGNGRIISNPKPQLIESLDDLPFPALHLFPMNRYHSSAQLRGRRTLHLLTSRGCPYNCSYCSGDLIFGRSFRFRSPGKVIEDIRKMIDDFGIDGIQFYDETFTVNRERVFALCDALDEAGLALPWTCFTRVDCVDETLLMRMKRSGCYQIFFGVETGVPRLLELIRKQTTLNQAREAFRLTRKIGIETVASFMLTLPTETEVETWQSVRFGLELDPDYVYWLTFVPYPGTELSEFCLTSGTITNKDPTTYNVFNEIIYIPENRTEEEIKRTVARAYRNFYLRPKYILRQLHRLLKLPPRKSWNLIMGGVRTLFRRKM